MINLTETVDRQAEIIKIQADVIKDLFGLLMQHITVEEADHLPAVEKINAAARLRATIETEANHEL